MDIKKRILKLEQGQPPSAEDSPELIFLTPGKTPDEEIKNAGCMFKGGGGVCQGQNESFEDFEKRATRLYEQQKQNNKNEV